MKMTIPCHRCGKEIEIEASDWYADHPEYIPVEFCDDCEQALDEIDQ